MLNGMAWQQVRDHDGEKWEGEAAAYPEPASHRVELRICFLVAHRHRLEEHTADGAIPRLIAPDLRMHGAGELRVGDGRADCFRLQSHSTLRTTARIRLENAW